MNTVYLPVEVSKREIVARAFLSARLASSGHRVITFRLDLFNRTGWPGPGIFVGKQFMNCYPPHDLSQYHKMKAAGLKVWFLDEEGGIYAGTKESQWKNELSRFWDLSFLGSDDKVLSWGEWQDEYWSTQPLSAQRHIVGAPNFDVYRSIYASSLSEFDAAQTGGRSNYILLNTRFAIANALNNGESHFINHGLIAKGYPAEQRVKWLAADGVIFYQFIGLVGALATRFPSREIILRPHPVEDPSTYQKMLASFPNVTVTGHGDASSWIRRCDILIHNGCTTAVQAAVAGKPVITYIPPSAASESNAALPNKIGVTATEPEEVFELIERGVAPTGAQVWQRTISEADAIERIAELVDREAPVIPQATVESVLRAARFFDASEVPRTLARLMLRQKKEEARRSMAKFDPSFFQLFPKLVEKAAAYYGFQVTTRRHSRFCYTVERS